MKMARSPAALAVFLLALVCTDVASAMGDLGSSGLQRDTGHEERLIAQMDWEQRPPHLMPLPDSRANNRGFFVQMKPIFGFSLPDIVGTDVVIQLMTMILQHIAMIQSQFVELESSLCCEPDADNVNSTFTFKYMAWPRGEEAGADRNRAATISALQGRMQEILSITDRQVSIKDVSRVTPNGTREWETVEIADHFSRSYTKVLEHLAGMLVTLISLSLTLQRPVQIMKNIAAFLLLLGNLIWLLSVEPVFMVLYMTINLLVFSLSEAIWLSVLGTSVCHGYIGHPALWGERSSDGSVSPEVRQFQVDGFHACSTAVKNFHDKKHGKCPSRSSWNDCREKESDYVRETASECQQRRFIYDVCATSQETYPSRDKWRYWLVDVLFFVGFYAFNIGFVHMAVTMEKAGYGTSVGSFTEASSIIASFGNKTGTGMAWGTHLPTMP